MSEQIIESASQRGFDSRSPRDVAGQIGRVGVWTKALSDLGIVAEREYVRRVEDMGSPALWVSEGLPRKEILSHCALLLQMSSELTVAAAIASIWARDPYAMANAGRMLGEAYPSRFILGVGVSHAPRVAERGRAYEKPYQSLRAYLQAMTNAKYAGPLPELGVPRVIGAQGPRMLGLAAEMTTGAHPYLCSVEETRSARETLGPLPLLAVEQGVILDMDTDRARAMVRDYLRTSLTLDAYRAKFARLGFDAREYTPEASDRLVDSVVAYGDVGKLVERIEQQLDAGADHVCIQVIGATPDFELATLQQIFDRVA